MWSYSSRDNTQHFFDLLQLSKSAMMYSCNNVDPLLQISQSNHKTYWEHSIFQCLVIPVHALYNVLQISMQLAAYPQFVQAKHTELQSRMQGEQFREVGLAERRRFIAHVQNPTAADVCRWRSNPKSFKRQQLLVTASHLLEFTRDLPTDTKPTSHFTPLVGRMFCGSPLEVQCHYLSDYRPFQSTWSGLLPLSGSLPVDTCKIRSMISLISQ